MAEITITHTAEQGTIVDGDPRPHHGILKDAGFRYSRNVGWYIRGSRDRKADGYRVEQAAKGLRDAGFDVTVDIDDTARPVAEREADKAVRSEERAEALAAKAGRLAEHADETIGRARQMADAIPLGQPLLVDHYSYKRDRIHRTYGKGFELHNEAKDTEQRSQAAEANQARRLSAPTTLRRVEKLEAEARKYQRELTPCPVSGIKTKPEAEGRTVTCPKCYFDVTAVNGVFSTHNVATGEYAERLTVRLAEIADEVAYWKDHLASLEANGVKLWTAADFKKGDLVKYWGGVREVVRVNKKSLSVKTEHSWTDKVTYDDVKGKVEQ